jgi:outer membrane protein TolC
VSIKRSWRQILRITSDCSEQQRSRETLLPLAEDRVRLALADYRAGKSPLSEVLTARRQRVETRLQDIDLQGQLAATAARLHFAYGEVRA